MQTVRELLFVYKYIKLALRTLIVAVENAEMVLANWSKALG